MSESHTNSASQPKDSPSSVWANTPTATNAPIEQAQATGRKRSGCGYGLTAIITSACSIVIAIVLPHLAVILAAGAAILAGVGTRRSTTTTARKLALTVLILSIIVVVAAVIYMIYTVVQGFARWEQLQ